MNISEFKQKYPVYANIPDDILAKAFWRKYYQEAMDWETFAGLVLPDYAKEYGARELAPTEELAGIPGETETATPQPTSHPTPPLQRQAVKEGPLLSAGRRTRSKYIHETQKEKGLDTEFIPLPPEMVNQLGWDEVDYFKQIGKGIMQDFARVGESITLPIDFITHKLGMSKKTDFSKYLSKWGREAVEWWQPEYKNKVQAIVGGAISRIPTIAWMYLSGGLGGAVSRVLTRTMPVLSKVAPTVATMAGRTVGEATVLASQEAVELGDKIMKADPHELVQNDDFVALVKYIEKEHPELKPVEQFEEARRLYADAARGDQYAISLLAYAVASAPVGTFAKAMGIIKETPAWNEAVREVGKKVVKNKLLYGVARLSRVAGTGAEWSALSQILSNAGEKMYLDKDKPLTEGVEESLKTGALAAILVNFMGESMGRLVRHKVKERVKEREGNVQQSRNETHVIGGGKGIPEDIQQAKTEKAPTVVSGREGKPDVEGVSRVSGEQGVSPTNGVRTGGERVYTALRAGRGTERVIGLPERAGKAQEKPQRAIPLGGKVEVEEGKPVEATGEVKGEVEQKQPAKEEQKPLRKRPSEYFIVNEIDTDTPLEPLDKKAYRIEPFEYEGMKFFVCATKKNGRTYEVRNKDTGLLVAGGFKTKKKAKEEAIKIIDEHGIENTKKAIQKRLEEMNLEPLEETVDEPSVKEPKAEYKETIKQQVFIPKEDEFKAAVESGKATKFDQNLRAIELIRQDKPPETYTNEERQEIAKYVGWGGLSEEAFGNKKGFEKRRERLKELLGEDEYNAARRSTLNAHYTSPEVVKALWEGVQKAGFKGGKVLEPGVGTGNFIGFMPKELRDKAQVIGVEMDPLTSKIAKILYPEAKIVNADFSKVKLPENSFDLIIGNPPFSSVKKGYKYGNKIVKLSLHNYFIVKSIDALKPNGVLGVVVTKHFLDNIPTAVRQLLAQKAEFLGAVRLPKTTFKKNAGTEVTTDIVFFRKLAKGEKPSNLLYHERGAVNGVEINKWYEAHPEYLLGEWKLGHGLYKADEPILEGQLDVEKLRDAITQLLEKSKVEQKPVEEAPVEIPDVDVVEVAGQARKNKKIIKGDKIVVDGRERKVTAREKGIIEIADTLEHLLDLQINPRAKDEEIEAVRKELNKKYDKFVKQFGYLHDKKNQQVLNGDYRLYSVIALENSDKSKSAIFFKRTTYPHITPTKADTVEDGLYISLQEKGEVDTKYIAKLVGKKEDEVIKELVSKKAIFFNPETKQYELPEVYLRGNIKHKLKIAEQEGLADNVAFLKEHLPPDVLAGDIKATMGAPWMSPDFVIDFLAQLGSYNKDYVREHVIYIPSLGKWSVKKIDQLWHISSKLATSKVKASWILDRILNRKPIEVKKTVYDEEKGKDVRVLDREATVEAQAKVREIKEAFIDWLWSDDERTMKVVQEYNDKVNVYAVGIKDTVPPMRLPMINTEIKPYPHQIRAAWRYITTRNPLLLFHSVGTGKTISAIITVMRMRQIGKVKKPLIVVPKSVVPQWIETFIKLYPTAKVLSPTKKDFQKENRRKFIAKIAQEDVDAVILSHSQLIFIENNKEFEEKELRRQLQEVEEGLRDKKLDGMTVKQLEMKKARLEEKINELLKIERDENIDFKHLGIDMIVVDEAHNFKNLQYITSLQRVKGLNDTKGSKRAFDMYLKVKQVREVNPKGVLFLTGTPLTNSLTEIYTMQKFLQPEALEALGIRNFDQWVDTFGEIESAPEINAVGKWVIVNRLSKLKNAKALRRTFDEVADFFNRNQLEKEMKEAGRENPIPKKEQEIVIIKPSPEQRRFIGEPNENGEYPENSLIYRWEHLKGHPGKGEDNALLLFTLAKKVALDMRMIDPHSPDYPKSKINTAVENIYKEWENSKGYKGTQLVFLDISVPQNAKERLKKELLKLQEAADKGDLEAIAQLEKISPDEIEAIMTHFDAYNDIKKKLIKKGIPENEIAFVHDWEGTKRKELYEKVNAGEIRILLGSTSKLGEGVNVQNKIIAIHHLDVPYKPSELEQRNGRAFRQGNELYSNGTIKAVKEYRYATEQTLDSLLWQLIEKKAKMIEDFIKGDKDEITDTGVESITAAEIKARTSGNPDILRMFEIKQEMEQLQIERRIHARNVRNAREALAKYKNDIEAFGTEKEQYEHDVESAKKVIETKGFEMTVGNTKYTDRTKAGEAIIKKLSDMHYGSGIIAWIGNFKIVAQKDLDKTFLKIIGKRDYWLDIGDYKRASPVGLTIRIENILKKIENLYKEYLAVIDQEKAVIDNLRQIAESKFEREKRLEELQREYDELLAKNMQDKTMKGIVKTEEANITEREEKLSLVRPNPPPIISNKAPSFDNIERENPQIRYGTDKVVVNGQEIKIPQERPITLEDFEFIIRKMFDNFVYRGKVRPKKLAGFFKKGEIRYAKYGDLSALTHETAHFLEWRFKEIKQFIEDNKDILANYRYEGAPAGKEAKEGFAEIMRMWLLNYPWLEENVDKSFLDRLNDILLSLPVKKYLLRLQEVGHKWTYQGALMRARAMQGDIVSKRTKMQYYLLDRPLAMLYTRTIDNMYGVMATEAVLGVKKPRAYRLFRGVNGHESGLFEAIVEQGIPEVIGKGLRYKGKVGHSLKWVFEPVKDKEEKVAFEYTSLYFAGKQALDMKERGEATPFTDVQIEEMLNIGKKYPEIEETYKRYQTFNREFLGFLCDMNLITSDTMEKIIKARPEYAPMNRVIDEIYNTDRRGTGLHRRYGSEEFKVNNIIDNILNNTAHLVRQAVIARAKSVLFKEIKESPNGAAFAVKINKDSKVYKAEMSSLANRVAEIIVDMGLRIDENGNIIKIEDVDSLDKEGLIKSIEDYLEEHPDMLMFWTGGYTPKHTGNYIERAIIDGEEQFFEIQKHGYARVLMESLQSLYRPAISNAVLTGMRVAKGVVTRTVVTMPQFFIANITRDIATRVVRGQSPEKMKPITSVMGIIKSMKRDKTFYEMLANLGGYGTLTESGRKVKDVAYILEMKKDIISRLRRWLDKFDRIMSAGEYGTRYAEYEESIKAGVSPEEAGWRAMNVTVDFARKGADPVVNAYLSTIAFARAGINGITTVLEDYFTYKGFVSPRNLYKFDATKLKIILMGLITLALPSIILWLFNRNNKRYQDLTVDQKMRYFWIFTDNGVFKIPLPYEIGLYAKIPELILDKLYKAGHQDMATALSWTVLNLYAPDVMPSVIQPFYDLWRNKDFRGENIVPESLLRVKPEYQSTFWTPQVYKMIGEKMGISPRKLQYLVDSFGGYVARNFEIITDMLLWDKQKWGDYPWGAEKLYSAFVGAKVPYRTFYTQSFWKLKQACDIERNTIRLLQKEAYFRGDKALQKELTLLNREMRNLSPKIDRVAKLLRRLEVKTKLIMTDKNLTADEKRDKIFELYKWRNEFIKKLYEAITNRINFVKNKLRKLGGE